MSTGRGGCVVKASRPNCRPPAMGRTGEYVTTHPAPRPKHGLGEASRGSIPVSGTAEWAATPRRMLDSNSEYLLT